MNNGDMKQLNKGFILYIGSGITTSCSLPGWDQLLDSLINSKWKNDSNNKTKKCNKFNKFNKFNKKKSKVIKKTKCMTSNQKLEYMNYLKELRDNGKHDIFIIRKKMADFYEYNFSRKGLSNAITKALIPKKLPCKLINTQLNNINNLKNAKAIITTNYNKFMVGQYLSSFKNKSEPIKWLNCIKKSEYLPSKIYSIDKNSNTKMTYTKSKLPIFQIHGTANHPPTITLGESQYKQLEKNKEYMKFMKHVMTSETVLYIGSSLGDDYLLKLRKNKYSNPHYAIIKKSQLNKMKDKAKEYNIKLIIFDDTEWSTKVNDILVKLNNK